MWWSRFELLLTSEVCVFVLMRWQILKPAEKKSKYAYSGMQASRPGTPPRNPVIKKK